MSIQRNRAIIRKIGNSLGVLLPHFLLQQVKIDRGDEVFISVIGDGTIVLTRVPTKFKERLIRA